MRERVDSFFFAPEKPQALAICRILFFGYLFFWYWSYDFNSIARHPEEFWYPIFLIEAAGINQIPSANTIAIFAAIWQVGLFLACIGLFTRAGILISLIFGTYLLGLTHSFAKVNHSDAGLMFAIGIFLFSRAGDALSVDRFLRNLRSGNREIVEPSGEYRWPIQMIRIVLVLIFFLAGFAKLWSSGLEWITSDHLATTLIRTQYTREVPIPIAEWIASMPWLCRLLAFSAIFWEVAAPVALFSVWARALIIPSLLGMQIGIRLLMGDDFSQFMALYLFWVPWLALGAAVRTVWSREAEVLERTAFGSVRGGRLARAEFRRKEEIFHDISEINPAKENDQ